MRIKEGCKKFGINKQVNKLTAASWQSTCVTTFSPIPICNFYQKSIQLQVGYSFLTVKSSSWKNGYPIGVRNGSQHVKEKKKIGRKKISRLEEKIRKMHAGRYVARKIHAYVLIWGCQKIRKIKGKISVAKHNAGRQESNYVCGWAFSGYSTFNRTDSCCLFIYILLKNKKKVIQRRIVFQNRIK